MVHLTRRKLVRSTGSHVVYGFLFLLLSFSHQQLWPPANVQKSCSSWCCAVTDAVIASSHSPLFVPHLCKALTQRGCRRLLLYCCIYSCLTLEAPRCEGHKDQAKHHSERACIRITQLHSPFLRVFLGSFAGQFFSADSEV